jgi:hypothetical protein
MRCRDKVGNQIQTETAKLIRPFRSMEVADHSGRAV